MPPTVKLSPMLSNRLCDSWKCRSGSPGHILDLEASQVPPNVALHPHDPKNKDHSYQKEQTICSLKANPQNPITQQPKRTNHLPPSPQINRNPPLPSTPGTPNPPIPNSTRLPQLPYPPLAPPTRPPHPPSGIRHPLPYSLCMLVFESSLSQVCFPELRKMVPGQQDTEAWNSKGFSTY